MAQRSSRTYGPASSGHVCFYDGGVTFKSPHTMPGNPSGEGGGKRAAVVKWSVASRRRLRLALLTYGPPVGSVVVGATFTIPGPVLTTPEAKRVWSWFSLHATIKGWSLIWRLELQQRGAMHWHAVVMTPDRIAFGSETLTAQDAVFVELCADALRRLWWAALDSLGRREFNPPYRGAADNWKAALRAVSGLSWLPGAEERSCVVDVGGVKGSWLRYLQDHASKAKQEQIPVGLGRHWGIVGRARLVRRVPESVTVGSAEYFRIMRALQRLSTPSIKAAGSPFGRKLGRRNRRGNFGLSVWFTKPDTVRRVVAWATTKGER